MEGEGTKMKELQQGREIGTKMKLQIKRWKKCEEEEDAERG